MIFKSYFSSSAGNLYSIQNGSTRLLIEAGKPIKVIKKALNFQLNTFAACLITHEHGDHAKAVNDILQAGVKVYCSIGTAQALGIDKHYNFVALNSGETKIIGRFKVMAFDTQHDAAQPIGFLIQDLESNQRLVFATDTYYLKYRFKSIDIYCVECNYIGSILAENYRKGIISHKQQKRTLKSHFSLENLIDYLSKTDLSKCNKIYLLHLSAGNNNAEQAKQTIQNKFFIETEICEE
jgi:phosphoribosyl 1,2-cyclic phosphodiesterase